MPELAAIPGISDLWELTDGDPRVRVAIIDGEVDRTHPCFEGAAIEVVPCGWLPEGCDAHMRVEHGTWVAGVLVGQHGSPSPGLAPRCTALVVPGLCDDMTERDPLNSARSIEAAIGAGAHVIVLEQGLPSRSGDVDGLLKSVVRGAEEAGVLVVAPVGNEGTRFQHFPQALPEVLVVGAHGDDGVMFAFSGWGPEYERHGIVAPGENISGPEPGGGLVTHKGTSCSAPIVGGVAALLLSLQVQDGQPPDPLAIRGVLLDTAQRCTLEESRGEPRRCLSGRLDVGAATRHVLHLASTSRPPARVRQDAQVDGRGLTAGVVPAQRADEPAAPDTAGPLVYALGSLGYDFGRPPRRDSFKQLMAPTDLDGTVVPANPHSPRQMVDHLQQHPSEAEALIWTLNIELTPIYAIGPVGAHAPRVYELLVRLLAGELADADDARRIERVGIPGRLSGRSVKLFSGQVVPVIEVEQIRGILGWPVAALTQAALEHVDRRGDDDAASRALREFLTRVYFELRNLGLTASDRALNFAVTNAVAAAQMLAAAVAAGMALDAIAVERSELCRPHSDCWDVTLRFFDPENLRRARRVSRLAVDVSDVVPVTLGPAQSWSESPPPRPALAATSDR